MSNKYWIVLTTISSIASMIPGWCQSRVISEKIVVEEIGCPTMPSSIQLDSVAIKASVDSVATQSTGSWKLVQISSSNSLPYKPSQLITMSLNKQGQGKIYRDGQQESTYQLTLSRGLEQIFFVIKESGKPYFNLFRNRGFLLTCGQILTMKSGRSDETKYVFQRIISNNASN